MWIVFWGFSFLGRLSSEVLVSVQTVSCGILFPCKLTPVMFSFCVDCHLWRSVSVWTVFYGNCFCVECLLWSLVSVCTIFCDVLFLCGLSPVLSCFCVDCLL